MITVFTDNPMDVVLRGFAEQYLSAARDLRTTNDGRFAWAARAHRYMAISVVASFAAVAFYVAMKVQETHP